MDNFNHLKDKAEEKLDHAKVKAHDLYESGKKQAHAAQENLQAHCDDIVDRIKEKPIHSVLIAAGIGYLLSKILK